MKSIPKESGQKYLTASKIRKKSNFSSLTCHANTFPDGKLRNTNPMLKWPSTHCRTMVDRRTAHARHRRKTYTSKSARKQGRTQHLGTGGTGCLELMPAEPFVQTKCCLGSWNCLEQALRRAAHLSSAPWQAPRTGWSSP